MSKRINHIELPPTEAGAKIKAALGDIAEPRIVYKRTIEDGQELWRFHSLYTEDAEETEEYITVPLTSVYEGTEPWDAGDDFANVLGSTGDYGYDEDEQVQRGWKEFAEMAGISWECHAETDSFFDSENGQLITGGKYTCNDRDQEQEVLSNRVCGGHVIPGTNAMSLEKGSSLYVIPICKHHNSVNLPHIDPDGTNRTPGNGNGFFMRLKDDTDVIKISAYAPNS